VLTATPHAELNCLRGNVTIHAPDHLLDLHEVLRSLHRGGNCEGNQKQSKHETGQRSHHLHSSAAAFVARRSSRVPGLSTNVAPPGHPCTDGPLSLQ
jgi:hypothetical protein